MSQKGYTHLILELRGNIDGQIILSNHLVIFLYFLDFPAHAGFEYPKSLPKDQYIA